MAKNFRPTGQDRFNFITALIGYLIHNPESPIVDVARHFEVSEEYVRDALQTMITTGSFVGSYEEFYYMYDEDALENEGIISLSLETDGIDDVPRLSGRQASAIAAGLTYLSTIPEFTNTEEIAELLEILGKGSNVEALRIFDYVPGTVDSDVSIIRRAIVNGHRITCEYVNQRGQRSVREIDPIRLDPRGDIWYLRGYCLKNQELRNFRLDHMRSATEIDLPISEEAKKIGEIVDDEYTIAENDIEVTIEADPEAYSLISDFAADVVSRDDKTGTVRATIKVGHLPNLGRVINHFGGAARVISPESARKIVRNYALTALGKATDDLLNED